MADFIPWNSQPLRSWAKKYATGKFVKPQGHSTHYIEKGKGDPVILLHGFAAYFLADNIDAHNSSILPHPLGHPTVEIPLCTAGSFYRIYKTAA